MKCSYCQRDLTQDKMRDINYPTLCGWHTQMLKGGMKIVNHLRELGQEVSV